MSNPLLLPCDGCGQPADSAHLSRRLQRLEWATRFRPVHIQALLLGGIAPQQDEDFLYTPAGPVQGEAHVILQAVRISTEGKSREAFLAEFQKLGLMLTHVLDCPLPSNVPLAQSHALVEKQLPATFVRIRRSLKPKRVLLLSIPLPQLADKLREADLGCPVLPSASGTFLPSLAPSESEYQLFRAALAGSPA
jgi:hypothetical protein